MPNLVDRMTRAFSDVTLGDEQGQVTTRRLYAHGHPAGVELKYA